MPLPFIIGGLAIAAGVGGIGSSIHGAAKMKEASDTMEAAKSRHSKKSHPDYQTVLGFPGPGTEGVVL